MNPRLKRPTDFTEALIKGVHGKLSCDELNAEAANWFQHQLEVELWTDPHGRVAQLVSGLGITKAHRDQFQIGYAPKEGFMDFARDYPSNDLLKLRLLYSNHDHLQPRFRERLIFPVFFKSQIVAFQGIATEARMENNEVVWPGNRAVVLSMPPTPIWSNPMVLPPGMISSLDKFLI